MQVIQEYRHEMGGFLSNEMLDEIYASIKGVDAEQCLRQSKEKTKLGRTLYAPRAMNMLFNHQFSHRGWKKHREEYGGGSEFEMDWVKHLIGLEVQFGKYAFLHTDMLRFLVYQRRDLIKLAVSILPSDDLQREMSTGVPCFRQQRDILSELGSSWAVPTLVLGITV